MQDILSTINLILIIVNIIAFCIFAVMFWKKSTQAELKSKKRFYIGVGAFFIFWAMMRIVFTISNNLLEEDYISYGITWKIASVLGIAALLSILIVMETYMVKSKYIFSTITLIGLVLSIVLPIEGREITGARLAAYITLPIGAISILLLYLYLYIKLPGGTRHRTGFITTGLALIFLGYILNVELMKQLISVEFVMDIIATVVMLLGGFLYTVLYYKQE